MPTVMTDFQTRADPLDVVEQVVTAEQYAYERAPDDELHFAAPGSWRDHPVWFAWSDRLQTLHVCLATGVMVQPDRRAALCELISLINERLWLGHFDLWSDDGAVVYRYALALPSGALPSQDQITAVIAAAIEAGERFYPAYNYMIWAGKSPQDAVAAALFDTAGEA